MAGEEVNGLILVGCQLDECGRHPGLRGMAASGCRVPVTVDENIVAGHIVCSRDRWLADRVDEAIREPSARCP